MIKKAWWSKRRKMMAIVMVLVLVATCFTGCGSKTKEASVTIYADSSTRDYKFEWARENRTEALKHPIKWSCIDGLAIVYVTFECYECGYKERWRLLAEKELLFKCEDCENSAYVIIRGC